MPPTVIIRKQYYNVRRLTVAQQIEAMTYAQKQLYPQECPCAVCGFRWMQHFGKLCPAKPGGYRYQPIVQQLLPEMPIWGDTEFIPDENFYKQPDFDVM